MEMRTYKAIINEVGNIEIYAMNGKKLGIIHKRYIHDKKLYTCDKEALYFTLETLYSQFLADFRVGRTRIDKFFFNISFSKREIKEGYINILEWIAFLYSDQPEKMGELINFTRTCYEKVEKIKSQMIRVKVKGMNR